MTTDVRNFEMPCYYVAPFTRTNTRTISAEQADKVLKRGILLGFLKTFPFRRVAQG